MSKRIIESVAQYNGTATNTEFTGFNSSDHTPVLERLKQSGAQNLMLILPGADGFNFLTQMKQFDQPSNETLAFRFFLCGRFNVNSTTNV